MNCSPRSSFAPIAHHSFFVGCACLWLACFAVRAAEPAGGDEDPRRAAIVMLKGDVECVMGEATKAVQIGMLLEPGAVLRTGRRSEAVVFFRQIGTMIRLRSETTVGLETMTKYLKDGVLLKETVLDLIKGEVMCVVRVLDAESKFEIKLPDYLVAFDGAGTGRFDLNAKGTVLVGRRSERPLRLRPLERGQQTILVQPGYAYSHTTGNVAPASKRILDSLRPELDKLEHLAKALTPPPRPEELRKRAAGTGPRG